MRKKENLIMMHYTHSPGGVFAVALYFQYYPPENMITLGAGLALGGIGGLLPDIDHSGSKITKKTGILGFIASRVLTHRGISHTPFLWTLLFGSILYYFPEFTYLALPCLLGCYSHILLDALTPQGVPLLAPLTFQKVNFLPIKTGGNIERVISLLLQAGCLILVMRLGWEGAF